MKKLNQINLFIMLQIGLVFKLCSGVDFFAHVPADDLLSIGYGRYGREDRFYTFKGSIDGLRIYDRALSAGEIEKLYQQGNMDISYLIQFILLYFKISCNYDFLHRTSQILSQHHLLHHDDYKGTAKNRVETIPLQ